MSDTQNTDPKPTEPAADTPRDEGLGDAGKRALDAERAARKEAEKQLKDYEARIEAFEDSKRTEAEKQAREIEKLRAENEATSKKLQDAEHQILVTGIAVEMEIPPSAWHRIGGGTAEEIRADAAELKKLFAPDGAKKPKPVPQEGRVSEGKRTSGQVFEDFFKSNF